MKKIGIITFVHVRNLGAGLQAYAMQYILNQLGCEVVYLKGYDRKAARELFSWDINFRLPSCLKPRNFRFILEKIIKFEKSFAHFHEQKLTARTLARCDRIILGSDSIWIPKIRSCAMDPSFFGGFDHDHISAYAASAGGYSDISQYSEAQLAPLKKLNYITVRDENTQKIVREASSREAALVLDPTLLINWYDVLRREKRNHRPVKEPYLLLYGWFPDHASLQIRAYAKEHGLKTISVGLMTGGADVRLAVSPLEFIQYMAYAEGVITCMFHGVMLSLAMNKQFRYVPQDPNRDRKVATTMNQIGVSPDDYYWNSETEDLVLGNMDYSQINAKKKSLIEDSLEWIRKMIE